MSIKIFNLAFDNVINSHVSLGQSNYKYALENVYPLINRFDAQRRFLDSKFYDRLEIDIIKGCLMPTITIAFIEEKLEIETKEHMEQFVNERISKGYILDGIQRLNTLFRASQNVKDFQRDKEIFFNIIIADNKDKLLYRMITLNNGQKPMTPRHQIEILTQELFDFGGLKIKIQTEKEKSDAPIKEAYSLGDISKGYIAFLTNNVHNENSKIIEEKMDQILVSRILETDFDSFKIQFSDVIAYIDKVSVNTTVRDWLKVGNNFIGFCVGVKKSFDLITNIEVEALAKALDTFDKSFLAINPSKVNVGKYRRELSKYFIENYNETFKMTVDELVVKFSEETI